MKNAEAIGERMGVTVKAFIERELAPIHEKIAALEARSAETMAFKGTYQPALTYRRGDAVISDGQLWYALRDHDAGEPKPGESASTGWTVTGKTR